MSNRLVEFEFTPGENEQIEATIITPKETRSVIHGTVKDYKNRLIKDSAVKLFEVIQHDGRRKLEAIASTVTDESGQFVFGPLCSNINYVIKVWVNDIKIKELIIRPDVEYTIEDDMDYEYRRESRSKFDNKTRRKNYIDYDNYEYNEF